jgi:hypothetical protein
MAWVFKEKLWKKNRSVSIADAEENRTKARQQNPEPIIRRNCDPAKMFQMNNL